MNIKREWKQYRLISHQIQLLKLNMHRRDFNPKLLDFSEMLLKSYNRDINKNRYNILKSVTYGSSYNDIQKIHYYEMTGNLENVYKKMPKECAESRKNT